MGVYSHSLLFCDIPSWRLATGLKIKKKLMVSNAQRILIPSWCFCGFYGQEQSNERGKKNGGEGKKMKNKQQNKKKYRNHLLPPYGARGQLDSTEELKATTFVVNYYYYRDLFCFVLFPLVFFRIFTKKEITKACVCCYL